MRRKSLYIFALAAIAFAGCQKNEINPDYAESDGIVKFVPSISGNGVMTKSQSSSSAETLDITLTSEDATMSIPMTCETVEGIGNCNAEEVVTKGELINEFGPGPQPFDTDESFVVKAWDASTSDNIIPGTATGAYQTVTYSTSSSLWSTSENYYWNEGETKTFYAYSNLPSSGASIANTTAASQTLTYTVPSTASAQTDILMGSCTSDGKSGAPATMTGTASILFSHPLTAVQFKLGIIEDLTSFVVNSITIEDVYANGTAVMTLTTAAESDPKDRFTWTPSGTKTVSQTISTQPTASAPKIGEAFLLIPQTFTESSTARIVINCTIDGKTADLYYPLTSGNWKAGYTNTYTIGYSSHTYEYTFELEESSDATQSFNNTTSASTPVIIPLISTVSVDGGEGTDAEWTIKSVKVGSAAAETVEGVSFTDIGGISAEITSGGKLSVTAAARTAFSPGLHDYWINSNGRINNLDWSPDDWSNEGVIDLSKMDFSKDNPTNSIGALAMNTANCYVIRHAGTYKLPLVYGNGIVNGAINEQSYYPNCKNDIVDGEIYTEGEDGNYRLVRFENHLGNGIISPFIEYNTTDGKDKCESNEYLSPASGAIVWQNTFKMYDEGYSDINYDANIVTNVSLSTEKESVTVKNANGVDETFSVSYITFTIPQSSIGQGNAIIAVKDDSGQIMWSWHIWITNDPALISAPISVINHTNQEYKFFPVYNLGCMNSSDYYPANEEVKILLSQSGSGNEIEITVQQDEVPGWSTSCHYQFGRKDPMPNTDYFRPQTTVYNSGTLAASILNPNVFYGLLHAPISDWLKDNHYYNLWTGKKSEAGEFDQDSDIIKTVYDPSPVGYKMPASDAFTGFTSTGDNRYDEAYFNGLIEWSREGIYLYTSGWKTGNIICFPWAGYSNESNGTIFATGSDCRYWSAVPCSNGSGYGMFAYTFYVLPLWEEFRSSGFSVRPVIDTTMPNNPMD